MNFRSIQAPARNNEDTGSRAKKPLRNGRLSAATRSANCLFNWLLFFAVLALLVTALANYLVSFKVYSNYHVDTSNLITNDNFAEVEKRLLTRLPETNLTQAQIDKSNWENRVYCMVPTMYDAHHVRLMQAIVGGWGAYCDVVKFFVDPSPSSVPIKITDPISGRSGEIVVVPMVRKLGGSCGDGKVCRHIWEKVWRSWSYVAEHDIDKAEWFLKIDDDSYFIASNLRRFVREKEWSPEEPHYFGHKVWVLENSKIISGVCSAFSRRSIRLMTERYKTMVHEYGPRENFPNSHGKCVDRDGATEERVTAKCLEDVGVFPEEAIDSQNREYVIPLGIPFTVTYKRKPTSTSWYWRFKPQTRGDRQNCCSFYAWGIHGYKSSSRMREMTDLLYNLDYEEVKKKFEKKKAESDEWWLFWYILKLRNGLRSDPYFVYWRPHLLPT